LKSLGRIVVHDRLEVESKVLPRYFNHSSFASLRRQLNYFSFVRIGKGRQLESTYLNESVADLNDILSLKRRSTGTAVAVLGVPGDELAKHLSLADDDDLTVVQVRSGSPSGGRKSAVASSSSTKTIRGKTTADSNGTPSLASTTKTSAGDSNDSNGKRPRRISANSSIVSSGTGSVRGGGADSPFLISEDEQESDHHFLLLRHQPKKKARVSFDFDDLDEGDGYDQPDEDIVKGCNALLGLSNLTWVA